MRWRLADVFGDPRRRQTKDSGVERKAASSEARRPSGGAVPTVHPTSLTASGDAWMRATQTRVRFPFEASQVSHSDLLHTPADRPAHSVSDWTTRPGEVKVLKT